jgi:heme exporter protein D
MLPRLERFLLGPKFACVEAEMRSEGITYHLAVLQRKGNKAAVAALERNIAAEAELAKLIDTRTPVALIVTGKGIINRRYSGNSDAADDAVIRNILPNSVAGELLLSRFASGEDGLMLSVARKESVNAIAARLKNLSVVSVLLGPCVTLTMLDLFGSIGSELICANHVFRFGEGAVHEVLHTSRGDHGYITLDGECIPEENVVSFAGALQGLTYTSAIPGEAAGFAERRKNFMRMKRYGAFVKSSVALTLLILLINFFLFMHLRNIKAELESDPRIHAESMQRFHDLNEKVTANREFFAASGLLGSASFPWLADQLAMNVPQDIVLSGVELAPSETFDREDTIGFRPDVILIRGSCAESSSLNSWLKLLQREEWVSSAVITGYSRGTFQLELTVR